MNKMLSSGELAFVDIFCCGRFIAEAKTFSYFPQEPLQTLLLSHLWNVFIYNLPNPQDKKKTQTAGFEISQKHTILLILSILKDLYVS